MSTRCSIFVYDRNGQPTAQLYHHCDGYPANMLDLIGTAYRKARKAGRAGHEWAASFLCATDPAQFCVEPIDARYGDLAYTYHVHPYTHDTGSEVWRVEVKDGTGGTGGEPMVALYYHPKAVGIEGLGEGVLDTDAIPNARGATPFGVRQRRIARYGVEVADRKI